MVPLRSVPVDISPFPRQHSAALGSDDRSGPICAILTDERPMATTAALVLAGGRGTRAGAGLPKQYRLLAGQPVLRRTLTLFANHPRVDAVRAVIHPEDAAVYAEAAAGLDLIEPVVVGATRPASNPKGPERFATPPPGK